MTRTVNCPECGGSGYRLGTYGDIECFDCSGEGQWEEELPGQADEQLTECAGDPFPNEWSNAA